MSQDLTAVVDSSADAVAQLLEIGGALTEPTSLEPGARGAFAGVIPDGWSLVVREYAVQGDRPERRTGTVHVRDVPSFAAYWSKHREATSEVYADVSVTGSGRIVAVINAPGGTDALAGWRDHRVVLELEHTPEWLRWVGANERLHPQRQFAELVEAGLSQIHAAEGSPTAAEMLDVAQHLQGATRTDWEAVTRLDNGDTSLVCRQSTEASVRGGLAIPSTFTLLLRPWRAALDAILVTARLRTQIEGGKAFLGYVLVDLDLKIEGAANGLLGQLEDALNEGVPEDQQVKVLRGTP